MTARNVGAFIGHGVGGELGQRIYDWKPRASQWHASLAKVFAIPLLVCLFDTPRHRHHLHRLICFSFFLGLVASQVGMIVHATMANVTAPRARASASAIHCIFDDLGKGGGPWVVAKLIKHYGRRKTFVWTTIIAWSGAAFTQYLCSFTVEDDKRKIRERGEAPTPTSAPLARHAWLAKSQTDVEYEFLDAADETTSLVRRGDRGAAQ